PAGAETVSVWIVKFVAGVLASMVTVLVLALVIRMKEKVESGGTLLDQLAAVRQRPLTLLVQRFVVAANAPVATARNIIAPARPISQGRVRRVCIILPTLYQKRPQKR